MPTEVRHPSERPVDRTRVQISMSGHTEAAAIRAILSSDAENDDALGRVLGEIMQCEGCTATVITHLSVTVIGLLDAVDAAAMDGVGWRTVLAARLAALLDVAETT